MSQAKLASAHISTGCDHGSGNAVPISASGVVTKLTTGIASALATADTTETCWNSSKVNGSRPNVTASWTRAAPRRPRQARTGQAGRRPSSRASAATIRAARKMTATAPNDSQPPADMTAHGSTSATKAAAQHSDRLTGTLRSASRATATVASISSVRCAGTPIPASRQ